MNVRLKESPVAQGELDEVITYFMLSVQPRQEKDSALPGNPEMPQ